MFCYHYPIGASHNLSMVILKEIEGRDNLFRAIYDLSFLQCDQTSFTAALFWGATPQLFGRPVLKDETCLWGNYQ